MAFLRIVTGEDGIASIEEVDMPDDVRQSEEERADALLKEKAASRASYGALTPKKGTDHAPHPKREQVVAEAD
jgi:hypothetical protein